MKRLEALAAEMKGEGFQFTGIKFAEPSDLVEASGEVYVVVPCELEVTQPDGSRHRQPSYLIGVSSDRGQNWKFLDGAGVGGDRDKLKQVLPKFPKSLQLPRL